MYTLNVGRFLVVCISDTDYIAKITQERPLMVKINSGGNKSQQDFTIKKELSEEIQMKGLKQFLLDKKAGGIIYPALIKEVENVYPKVETLKPIELKKPVVEAPVVPIKKPEEILIPKVPAPAKEEPKPEIPKVVEAETPETIEKDEDESFFITETKTIVKKPVVPKATHDKKILGNLYFDINFSIQKETGMKIGEDYNFTKDFPKIIITPSKSKGKLTQQHRLEKTYAFIKEKYVKESQLPYFHIELPEEMPSDVLVLGLENEYKRRLDLKNH